MKLQNKIIRFLELISNRRLRVEREKNSALLEANAILSAYIAILIENDGGVRVSRELIRSVVGRYRAEVSVSGDDYVISVKGDGESFCRTTAKEKSDEAEALGAGGTAESQKEKITSREG